MIELADDHISLDFMAGTALDATCLCGFHSDNAHELSIHLYNCEQLKDIKPEVRSMILDFATTKALLHFKP